LALRSSGPMKPWWKESPSNPLHRSSSRKGKKEIDPQDCFAFLRVAGEVHLVAAPQCISLVNFLRSSGPGSSTTDIRACQENHS
jgi:hypothetical protein